MIILPPVRPVCLQAFVLAMGTLALLSGVLLSLADFFSEHWLSFGILFIVTAVGFFKPEIARLPYRLWNRLVRLYIRYTSYFLICVCFAVIASVRENGKKLKLSRSGDTESLWTARRILRADPYSARHAGHVKARSTFSLIETLRSCAAQSGNYRIYVMLPFLVLLSSLGSDEEEPFPTAIYTLF